MKIFYPEYCIWEKDYILNNVLSGIKLQEIHYYSNQNFLEILDKFSNCKNCILVLTSYLQENEMFQVASILKPNVIILLSDEYGTKSNLMKLEKLTRLFLRNYNHCSYSYASNNLQLPLGYVSNFLDCKSFIKKMNQRSINCSFIGEQKSDRLEMYNTFKKNMTNTKIEFTNNSWVLESLKWTPANLFELYNDSIFVINGRGNCSLDCFRIYESISAGAIPVIVGDPKEIKNTFYYNDNVPPLLFFNSWQEAVTNCNNLLEKLDQLQEIQNNLQLWWKNILENMKLKINS